MRTKIMCLAFTGALMVALAVPLHRTGAVHANPDSNPTTVDCMGVERGIRNRNGGDRQHGGFGPGQADFVTVVDPYGQWLKGGDCPPVP